MQIITFIMSNAEKSTHLLFPPKNLYYVDSYPFFKALLKYTYSNTSTDISSISQTANLSLHFCWHSTQELGVYSIYYQQS